MREICVAEKHISENVPVIYLELEAPEYSSSRVLAEGRVVTKTVKCSGWSADIHFSKKKKETYHSFLPEYSQGTQGRSMLEWARVKEEKTRRRYMKWKKTRTQLEKDKAELQKAKEDKTKGRRQDKVSITSHTRGR